MFRLALRLFPRCALLVGLSLLCSSRLQRRKLNVNIELVFCLFVFFYQSRTLSSSLWSRRQELDCILFGPCQLVQLHFQRSLTDLHRGVYLTLSNVEMQHSVPWMKIYRQQLYAIQFVGPPSYAAGERPAGSTHNLILSTAELADKSEAVPNKCGRSWQSLCSGRTLR